MDDLRYKETWSGVHRGIPFEVCRVPGREEVHEFEAHWTFYIYVDERCFPADVRDRFVLTPRLDTLGGGKTQYLVYDYSDSRWANLQWHCGITFYEVIQGFRGSRIVKAGCDYQHYWDEGVEYHREYVTHEAYLCIDSLHEQVPGLMVMDRQTGEFVTAESIAAAGREVGK